MLAQPVWHPTYILPNITLTGAIEGALMAIAPREDSRIAAMVESDPNFTSYLDRFTNVYGEAIKPSTVIHRTDIAPTYLTTEAVAAFRNCIAIAAICNARSHHFAKTWTRGPFFFESFAFYPWLMSKEGSKLYLDSPSSRVEGLDIAKIHPQAHPALSTVSLHPSQLDEPLLRELLKWWAMRFHPEQATNLQSPQEKNRQERIRINLFRSLNMACQACSNDDLGDEHIYNHGRSIMNWISAFEVLVHAKCGNANKKAVIAHLLESAGDPEIYKKERVFTGSHKTKTVTAWLYENLNSLRNDFAHGNPIDHSKLVIDEADPMLMFIHLAPALYRSALATTLEIDCRTYRTNLETVDGLSDGIVKQLWPNNGREASDEALRKVLSLKFGDLITP